MEQLVYPFPLFPHKRVKTLFLCPPKRTKTRFHSTFLAMENLIDSNSCDYEIQRQLKKDYSSKKVPLQKNTHKLNVIIRKNQPQSTLAEYYHGCCFSPVKHTWQQAIQQGFFLSWVGLTYQLVAKHLHNQIATSQGHMVQEKQGLQSTTKPVLTHKQKMQEIRDKFHALKKKMKGNNSVIEALLTDITEDFFPKSNTPNLKTNDVCYALLNKEDLSIAY